MAVEQTTTGAATPSYKLDSDIIEAVGAAGRSGSKARGILQGKSSNVASMIKGAADATVKAGKDIRAKTQAARQAKIDAVEAFNAGFDKMSESGAWANENLFSQFESMEKVEKEKYLTAVRDGDKGEMAKIMQSQKQRSNSLQQWRGTMEAAQKIHNGVGWSKAFMSDDPKAQKKRELLTALAEMGPDTAKNMVFEDGQMVYKIGDETYTRREIDELVAEGTKPLNLELGYMEELSNAEAAGAEGKPFNYDRELNTARLSIKNENINAMMTEDFGGGGSFSQHIMSHPDFAKAFQSGGFQGVKLSADSKDIYDAAKADGIITTDEYKKFPEEDMQKIIEAMGKEGNEDIAREYLAEYKTLQLQNAHNLGAGKEESEFQARQKFINNMSQTERENFTKNPPPEFQKDDGSGEFDYYKFLGWTQ
jgi:hypothetical protein